MAQFVGGESKYNGVMAGLREIYKENGLIGNVVHAVNGRSSKFERSPT
jgi:hypothetical protein